ncbi:AraC family transcriptional regulator [Puteibacter caeruleilacunae]|nr:AraC family transcriptional regulator [Puteibacter caeruleilacunae]
MSDFLKINTLTELFRLMELPAPKHPLIAFVDFEVTPVMIEIPEVKVVCGFYQVSFKSEAAGSIKYGRESYDYQEGSLLYIAPEQVMEYGELSDKEINKNWVLFFHPDLLQSFGLAEKMNDYDFFDYNSNEALHISEKEKQIIESIIDKIEIELDSNLDDFSEEVIVTNLELLLNYSKRFYNRQFITRKRFSSGVVKQFEVLLKEYFKKGIQKENGIPTIQYFAEGLNYSPNYLGDIIKKVTGKSVLEHIHLEIISLAKLRLLNSDKSVSEIAYDMGFEYSQYFSRLFKKKTGVTPNEYRKSVG